MMRHHAAGSDRWILGVLVAAAATAACNTETQIIQIPVEVPVERVLFEPPPEAAAGFLGFNDVATQFTTCGECHVNKQATWAETEHAEAWEDLQNSGHAATSCEICHSVSENGNAAEGDVGYTAVQDPRYHNVQCENCHGAGLGHVDGSDPNPPLAPALVGPDLEYGCGECHSGVHNPFVEEWSQSPHSHVVEFAAANESCQGCHRGQGTLTRFGVNSEYIEKDAAEPLPVVCVVCHDPHDATNEHQLRYPVNTTSIESHLCAQCHNRRTAPDPASSHGLAPHAPEAALLVGDAGWFPPGAIINQGEIFGTHGSGANEELCATCHVASFEVTDEATGGFVFGATGHLFRPIPCLDAEGIPLPFGVPCDLSVEARYWGGCTRSGCHGSATAAFSALTAASTRIQGWADDLLALLTQVDPNLDEAGGEIDPADPTFTTAEGAFFNYSLSIHGNSEFGTNTVIGSTVHNPFLMEALLIASIDAVETEYGVAVPEIVNRRVQLLEVLQRSGIR